MLSERYTSGKSQDDVLSFRNQIDKMLASSNDVPTQIRLLETSHRSTAEDKKKMEVGQRALGK